MIAAPRSILSVVPPPPLTRFDNSRLWKIFWTVGARKICGAREFDNAFVLGDREIPLVEMKVGPVGISKLMTWAVARWGKFVPVKVISLIGDSIVRGCILLVDICSIQLIVLQYFCHSTLDILLENVLLGLGMCNKVL